MSRKLGVEIVTDFVIDLEAERMRRENEEAFKRLRQYIEEHRGNTLGLEIFTALFSQHRQ